MLHVLSEWSSLCCSIGEHSQALELANQDSGHGLSSSRRVVHGTSSPGEIRNAEARVTDASVVERKVEHNQRWHPKITKTGRIVPRMGYTLEDTKKPWRMAASQNWGMEHLGVESGLVEHAGDGKKNFCGRGPRRLLCIDSWPQLESVSR